MFQLASLQTSSRSSASLMNTHDAWPTLDEVIRQLTFRAGYNATVVTAGTMMLGIAAGLVGTCLLLRKRSLMADALSHATLPGIAGAFYLAALVGLPGKSLPILLTGAAATGVLGVVCIHLLVAHTRLRDDAAIGIVLSVFFGVGVVLLGIVQRLPTGNQAGLARFIYGQTASITGTDVALMSALAGTTILVVALFRKEFAIVSFNADFAGVTGWPVTLIDMLLMAIVVIVTVSGLQIVGLILIVALLIIPAAAARFWTDRLWMLIVLSGFIGGLSGYLGASMSALLPRKPAGAVIVLTAGAIFLLSMFCAPARGVVAGSVRRGRMRLRIACDHMLEALYEAEQGASQQTNQRSSRAAVRIEDVARLRGWGVIRARAISHWLRVRGLMSQDGSGWALTASGRRDGARVSRNHRLWEQYLTLHAAVAPSHVDWSVDQVEHVLSEEFVAELEASLRADGVFVPSADGGEGDAP